MSGDERRRSDQHSGEASAADDDGDRVSRVRRIEFFEIDGAQTFDLTALEDEYFKLSIVATEGGQATLQVRPTRC